MSVLMCSWGRELTAIVGEIVFTLTDIFLFRWTAGENKPAVSVRETQTSDCWVHVWLSVCRIWWMFWPGEDVLDMISSSFGVQWTWWPSLASQLLQKSLCGMALDSFPFTASSTQYKPCSTGSNHLLNIYRSIQHPSVFPCPQYEAAKLRTQERWQMDASHYRHFTWKSQVCFPCGTGSLFFWSASWPFMNISWHHVCHSCLGFDIKATQLGKVRH